jgi:hypothetical protein
MADTVNAVDPRPASDAVLKELSSGSASVVTHHGIWSDHVCLARIDGTAGRVHNPLMGWGSCASSKLVSNDSSLDLGRLWLHHNRFLSRSAAR